MSTARMQCLIGMMSLTISMMSGCAAFHHLKGIPARYLPPELQAPSRADESTIDLSLLGQVPPTQHIVDRGDVLGIFIEGVLGNPGEAPPVSFPTSPNAAPTLGYPLMVRDDGTISLPLVGAVDVRGLTVRQVEEYLRKLFTVDRKILKVGQDRIIVTLQKPRDVRVLVYRQETGGATGGFEFAQGVQINLGQSKRGSGRLVHLPIYKNDILHALAETGGLPGLDAENTIYIIRRKERIVQTAPSQAVTPQQNGFPTRPTLTPGFDSVSQTGYRAPSVMSQQGAIQQVDYTIQTDMAVGFDPYVPKPGVPKRTASYESRRSIPDIQADSLLSGNQIPSAWGRQSGQQESIPKRLANVTSRRQLPQSNEILRADDHGEIPSPWNSPTVLPGIEQNRVMNRIGHQPHPQVVSQSAVQGQSMPVQPMIQTNPVAQQQTMQQIPTMPIQDPISSIPQHQIQTTLPPHPVPDSLNQHPQLMGPPQMVQQPMQTMQTPMLSQPQPQIYQDAIPHHQFDTSNWPPSLPQELLSMGQFGVEPTINRQDVIKIPIRLKPGQNPNIRPQDVILHDGDVVFIESRDTEIFYTGGLLGGGQFTLPRDYDLDVLGAIAIAQAAGNQVATRQIGGPSALNGDVTVSASNVIILRQAPNGGQVPIKVDLYRAMKDPTERILIQPGDVVMLRYKPHEAVVAFVERNLLETALFGLAVSALNGGNNN